MAEIIDRVGHVPTNDGLHFLACLSAVVEGHETDMNLQGSIVRVADTLWRHHQAQILSILSQQRPFIHQQILLATANLLIVHGLPQGEEVRHIRPDLAQDLVEVLLRVGDLIDPVAVGPSDDAKQRLILRKYQLAHHEPPPLALARWHTLLNDIAPRHQEFDAIGAFLGECGLTPQGYFTAGLLLYAGFVVRGSQKGIGGVLPEMMLADADYFRGVANVATIVDTIGITPLQLRDELQEQQARGADLFYRFRHFRRSPLLRVGPAFMPISMELLANRISVGAHYVVMERATPSVQKAYMDWLGGVYEEYITDTLGKAWPVHPGGKAPLADTTSFLTPMDVLLVENKTKRTRMDTVETGDLEHFRTDLSQVQRGGSQLLQRVTDIRAGKYGLTVPTDAKLYPMVTTLESTPAVLALWDLVREDCFCHRYGDDVVGPTVTSTFDIEVLTQAGLDGLDVLAALQAWSADPTQFTLADYLIHETPWQARYPTWLDETWKGLYRGATDQLREAMGMGEPPA